MNRIITHYGWKPDLPDFRDLKYAAGNDTLKSLPPKVDLRKMLPPVYQQENINSCTANAIAAAFQYEMIRQKAISVFMPSRLFIYYNARDIEGTTAIDKGSQIRDGIKSIGSSGVCPESLWPYVPQAYAQKPTTVCYTDALKHTAINYKRVQQNENQLKSCLAEGFPFIAGLSVFTSFENPEFSKTGILNLPASDEKPLGGHAVLIVGYDDSAKRFIARNSWGAEWGMTGYFTLPYEYLTNADLSRDFWTIQLISS